MKSERIVLPWTNTQESDEAFCFLCRFGWGDWLKPEHLE